MTATVSQRYEIEELVASGGMADVYRGRDRVLGRQVAIKRLRRTGDDGAPRERFEREARLLAGFSHPNAVAVYDAAEDEDGPLIVMEYVEGPTLRAHLERAGVLPVEDAVAIADQLLSALGAAHAQGIVHRDVKPANVLITTDGRVKLADFGIATMAGGADLTVSGEVVGTPKYLSPEQVVGKRATPQSDLYAVGVLCFEMVCGRAPFVGETPVATMTAHQRAPVPSMREWCPEAPDWYVAAVEQALAKDPAQRYVDATAMLAALRSGALGDVTVADSTIALPVRVEPEPEAVVAGARGRRGGGWALVLFVLLGSLIAAGVWALGSPDDPAVVPPPTEVPTLPATVLPPITTPVATVAPTAPVVVPGAGAKAGKAPKEKAPKPAKAPKEKKPKDG